jgi:hypothetical protein
LGAPLGFGAGFRDGGLNGSRIGVASPVFFPIRFILDFPAALRFACLLAIGFPDFALRGMGFLAEGSLLHTKIDPAHGKSKSDVTWPSAPRKH